MEIPSRIMRKRLRRRLVRKVILFGLEKNPFWEKIQVDENVGDELFMPTNTIPIPIIVNVVIMCAYIAFGAFILSGWEEWDLPSAVYFAFVTLLTIGFGDYVRPDKDLSPECNWSWK
jgi:hypothetical protein